MIRCKECVYAWKSSDGQLRCEKYGTYDTDCVVDDNSFCAYGSTMHNRYMNLEQTVVHDLDENENDLPAILKNVLVMAEEYNEPVVAYRTRRGFVAYGPIPGVVSNPVYLHVHKWKEIDFDF